MKNKIKLLFNKYDIHLSELQIFEFYTYFNELLVWSQRMNLTAIKQPEEIIIKHFIDSAYPYKFIETNSKALDIGAGAGFPSLPLKILRKDLNITMLDSLKKRIDFLNHIVALLNLSNINATHSRIEDFKEKDSYDIVVARAVAELPILIEYALPFLKIGGFLFAYKSLKSDFEISKSNNALAILGGEISNVITYDIEGNQRSLIKIKKIKNSPKQFPRNKNLPRKNPL